MTPGHGAAGFARIALATVATAALVQIALGLAGLLAATAGVDWARPTAVRDWQRAIIVVAFGGLAAHLLLGSRRNARIEHLGVLFLLIAVFFAHPPILALAEGLPPSAGRIVLGLRAVTVDAFTPAIAWLFVRDFPRALEWPRTAAFVRAMISISVAAAIVLVSANVAIAVRGDAGALAFLARTDPDSAYWAVVFGLVLPVLPFALWRTRHAPRDERRRVGLFASGVAAAAVLPVVIAILPPLSPAFREFVHGDWAKTFLIPMNLLLILAMAATTTYAVVVQGVLDVRTVLRKAAQYWLAVTVVVTFAGLPSLAVLALLYASRDEPLSRIFGGARGVEIAGLAALSAVVWRVRRPVMLTVDRLFFREPYSPEEVLAAIAQESHTAATLEGLVSAVTSRIGRAVHPESIGVLVAAPATGDFVPVACGLRTLPGGSALAERLGRHGAPLPVDLARPAAPLRDLPDEERVWLGDAGATLLVPLVGSAGAVDGILALGAKRSELPYSREDRLLLEAIGGATAMGIENRRLRDRGLAADVGAESRAHECVTCGRITAPDSDRCGECGGRVREAALPERLFGKFRLERRIGEGGMGVVYGAMDLALNRTVALKTLPRTSPEDAETLRREARAMAAITHPNLALILGAETWQGTPVLVLEHLSGGTLEARIARAPLAPAEAFEIAHRMARVLERLHASGLLHRDVKPSNVGFTAEGEPKLLDFGLVQILADVVPPRPHSVETLIEETGLAGTPLYMSPEALDAGRPDPGFDLWGLAVVVFEAVTGVHPFERATAGETLAAIRRGWTRELALRLPPRAGVAADLFESVLAAERARRPNTASVLAERLRTAARAASDTASARAAPALLA
jgi:hypothetical protein